MRVGDAGRSSMIRLMAYSNAVADASPLDHLIDVIVGCVFVRSQHLQQSGHTIDEQILSLLSHWSGSGDSLWRNSDHQRLVSGNREVLLS